MPHVMIENSFIGASASIQRLRAYLLKLSDSNANVFIEGETGTGKECVATFLHAHGPRSSKPMVCVNCAAIPDSLFESELFGYRRGAFTGAAESYSGQLRRAHGGTLFLDELGDLSLLGQSKLLRVLENREILPLGGTQALALDVRVIVATNSSPEALVQAKQLRADLYYRLNVARVKIPPLRDRERDVLELFNYFMKKFLPSGGQALRLASDAAAYLLKYDWPGNVRELRNLVERILVDPPQGEIMVENLIASLGGDSRHRPPMDEEKAKILEALFETRWNKRMAAAKLNWSRMTLYRKLAKYRISRSTS
jgi:transcriptional regulator with PAS, ATPase and Fis domain